MQRTETTAPKKQSWKRPFFYGWVIVGVTALLQFAGGTPTFPVLGLFLKPMTEDLGWSRAGYALPLTIGTIIGGFAGMITGPAMDKYGPKWIMTVAAVVVGSSFTLMSFVHEYWQYFILQIVTRSVTAGAFFMVVGILLPKWFVLKRGRATAISGLGGSLGQFFTPILVTALILGLGWRSGWVGLGVLVWVVAIVPVFLFVKGKPEDMGLLPDGLSAEEAAAEKARRASQATDSKSSVQRVVADVSFTVGEALRTKTFYLMTLGQCALALVISGLHFHWFAYMTGAGVSDSVAVGSISVSSLASIPGSFAGGFLSERIHVRHLLVVASLGFGLSVLILLFTSSPVMAYVYGISLGVFSGVMFTTTLVVYADYFGREHLGAIRGISSPIGQITNASGPLVASLAFDMTGNYAAILWIFFALTMVTAVCWLFATQPKKKGPAHLAAPAPAG